MVRHNLSSEHFVAPPVTPPLGTPVVRRVLLVEDDSAIRALVALQLMACHVKVYDARDGREALTFLGPSGVAPDLVVLDLMLPISSGQDVINFVRSSPDDRLRNIPIIVLTGAPEDMQQNALNAGASAVITKPWSKTQLIQHVKMFLDSDRVITSPAIPVAPPEPRKD